MEGQFQAVSDQFFLQFMVFLEVELQQIGRPYDFCSLQGQFSALVAEQHFLKHCLTCLTDSFHETIGYFDLSREDYVEMFDLVSCLVQLEW